MQRNANCNMPCELSESIAVESTTNSIIKWSAKDCTKEINGYGSKRNNGFYSATMEFMDNL